MAGETRTSASPVHRFILLTDIVQSSRLAEQCGRAYLAALEQHNQLVEQAVKRHSGEVYKQTGDGYLVLFETADACLEAALELGEALEHLEPLTADELLLVRLAMHAGALQPSGEEYFGPALNRVSRICQVCNPGQVLLSDAVKATLPKALDGFELRDLGQHHLRDLAEPEQLYQLDSEHFSRHDFPPLTTLDNRPNNLVRQPNHFIGREQELKGLADVLLDDTYLLSIVAPGGYGKSRLAAQLCANLLHRFENGVFMAYLAPVRESLDVPSAIANALGFQFTAGRTPEQQLCDYLREKELLLCLDNFEHVLDSAPLVAELLQAAPRLKVVITSREPLRLQGEHIYRLQPLPIEAAGGEQYSEAQTLFADRAALVSSGFTLGADNAAQVQKICEQLSGIPLAIELAAAWMDTFALAELSDELSEQLELEARASDRPERHQSLKACLDWSWNLLGEEQQETLMRLSTFRGGFFSDAATTVLGVKGMKLRATLGRLADKSWLYSREVNGQARFFLRDMLALEYALAKLQRSELYEPAVMTHAAYFSALMDREGPRLYGDGTPTGQLEALATLRLEQQNIAETLDTLLKRSRPKDANEDTAALLLPIASHLLEFFDTTSAYRELAERYHALRQVSEQADALQPILVYALLGCSVGQRRLGDNDAARENSMRAGQIAKATGDRYGIASSLHKQGIVEHNQGNNDFARELYVKSLAIRREIGDRSGIATSLNMLGLVESDQGNYDAARELYVESLAIQREIGDRSGIAMSLNNLGIVEDIQGNYDTARGLYSEALAIHREVDRRSGGAWCLNNLGLVEYNEGNYDAARELYAESLAIKREVGDRPGSAMSLFNLGKVECRQGNYDAARELHAESLAIWREIGHRPYAAWSLINLGLVEYSQSNNKAARELYAESLAVMREIGNRVGEANALHGLAVISYALKELPQAEELLSQALAILREAGDRSEICASFVVCGSLLGSCALLSQAAVCLYGALHHVERLDYHFELMERELLEQALELVEQPESGLAEAQREQLKAQAEAMSLDELAEFALDALANLKARLPAGSGGQQANA